MIQNMRDLGGLKTEDGRVVKPHMLVRSAQLLQAEETDLKHIATVIDLRTPAERKETPDLTYNCEYLPIPVFADITAGISHEEGSDDRWKMPDMAILYGRLMNECVSSFGNIVRAIMQHDFSKGAVLWHCSEGKDRCGMTTALVLEILGADRRTIMDDYLKTNLINIPKAVRIHDKLVATHGEEYARSVYQAYIADERYLKAAWDAMGNGYISERLGIDQQSIELFRNTVLE